MSKIIEEIEINRELDFKNNFKQPLDNNSIIKNEDGDKFILLCLDEKISNAICLENKMFLVNLKNRLK